MVDTEVIVEMTPEQLGLPKGATVKQVLDRMQELGMRPMTVEEAQRMLDARPIPETPGNMFALSRGSDFGHWQTPPEQFELPNGQSLGDLLSAVDHDPVIHGVFLDGKPLRQSDCKRLRPQLPDDNPHDWMTAAEIDREMMEDADAMDGIPRGSMYAFNCELFEPSQAQIDEAADQKEERRDC